MHKKNEQYLWSVPARKESKRRGRQRRNRYKKKEEYLWSDSGEKRVEPSGAVAGQKTKEYLWSGVEPSGAVAGKEGWKERVEREERDRGKREVRER